MCAAHIPPVDRPRLEHSNALLSRQKSRCRQTKLTIKECMRMLANVIHLRSCKVILTCRTIITVLSLKQYADYLLVCLDWRLVKASRCCSSERLTGGYWGLQEKTSPSSWAWRQYFCAHQCACHSLWTLVAFCLPLESLHIARRLAFKSSNAFHIDLDQSQACWGHGMLSQERPRCTFFSNDNMQDCTMWTDFARKVSRFRVFWAICFTAEGMGLLPFWALLPCWSSSFSLLFDLEPCIIWGVQHIQYVHRCSDDAIWQLNCLSITEPSLV